jgi:hypothetical protein
MTNRRAFLRMAGAAPLAAKAVAEQAAASMSGMEISGLASNALRSGGIGVPPAASEEDWAKKALDFLTQHGIPEWKEREIRRRHAHVYTLDPDIAAKKSWSMAVKIATQRSRNIEREMNGLFDRASDMEGSRFRQKYGYWL